jgi:glycine/D-amino acid oxidase-like deaminating enzyme
MLPAKQRIYMNLRSGFPFWLIKNGLPFDYPKLENSTKKDVAILGGGISGALTAYHLVQRGIECIVVDARSIGLGSTCASTAMLQYEIDVPLSKLKDMIGLERANRSYRLCLNAILGLGRIARKIGFKDFSFRQSLYYAAYKKDISFLEKEFAVRKSNGFNVSFLSENEIHKHYGFKAPAAILSRNAGETNAYLFTHFLLQYCIKKGVQVFDRTNIKKFNHSRNGVVLRTENGQSIRARKLIYATGYETVNYFDKPIVKLYSTYATISEQVGQDDNFWKENVIIWNTAKPYLYLRTIENDRILVGGRDEAFYSPSKRDKLILRKGRQLSNDFKKLFPYLPFKPEFCWTGTFGSTKDGLPYIGPHNKLPNSYFALGFGGNGITFSEVAGNILADLIVGKKNKDAEIFSFNRV